MSFSTADNQNQMNKPIKQITTGLPLAYLDQLMGLRTVEATEFTTEVSLRMPSTGTWYIAIERLFLAVRMRNVYSLACMRVSGTSRRCDQSGYY